jgi:hypothetical protein
LDTVVVNGPEDVPDWDAIDWRSHEANVVRLRRRIFKATREQDWASVRSLQKMMLGSWSNTLVSVRQVTQRNAGRRTAGVDGQVALSSQARGDTAVQVHRTRCSWDPLPVRRVHIPKANGKQRPLGIPVILDRCHQARVKNALEPEWEARFEPRSYGFRPGRRANCEIVKISRPRRMIQVPTAAGARAKRFRLVPAGSSFISALLPIGDHHPPQATRYNAWTEGDGHPFLEDLDARVVPTSTSGTARMHSDHRSR